MTESPTPTSKRPVPLQYDIRLAGHLDERWIAWFDGLTIRHDADGTTMLTVAVADQAALHGALQRVRDVGLSLISITRTNARAGLPPGPAGAVPERKSR